MSQHVYIVKVFGKDGKLVDVDDPCFFGEDGAIARMNELNIKNPDYIHVVQRLECKAQRTLDEKKRMSELLIHYFKGKLFDCLAANPNRIIGYKEIRDLIPECWSESTYRFRLWSSAHRLREDDKQPIFYIKNKGYMYKPNANEFEILTGTLLKEEK